MGIICGGFSAIFLDHAFGCRARTPADFESRGDFQITVRNKFISARAVDGGGFSDWRNAVVAVPVADYRRTSKREIG